MTIATRRRALLNTRLRIELTPGRWRRKVLENRRGDAIYRRGSQFVYKARRFTCGAFAEMLMEQSCKFLVLASNKRSLAVRGVQAHEITMRVFRQRIETHRLACHDYCTFEIARLLQTGAQGA